MKKLTTVLAVLAVLATASLAAAGNFATIQAEQMNHASAAGLANADLATTLADLAASAADHQSGQLLARADLDSHPYAGTTAAASQSAAVTEAWSTAAAALSPEVSAAQRLKETLDPLSLVETYQLLPAMSWDMQAAMVVMAPAYAAADITLGATKLAGGIVYAALMSPVLIHQGAMNMADAVRAALH